MKSLPMHVRSLLILLIVLGIIIISQDSVAGPVKRALIIAVGDYPANTNWPDISSLNDVALIKGALKKQGFEDKNVLLISDSAATKTGIINAFNKLISQIGKGDFIVIHYSGHGQQIFDDNGDEVDGYDETIIPWGAPAYFSAGYTGDKHLRDDELGNLVNELRARAGKEGQVLVFLDACHSGSGTRGVSIPRGGFPPLQPPDFVPNPAQGITNEKEKGFGVDPSTSKTRGANDDMAPFILFSGASANELNYETTDENGKGVGSLSYAIGKAFNSIDNSTTYRGLFASILTTMAVVAPRQTPILEGDIDYKVFNGQSVKQEPYYIISEVKGSRQLKIDGGMLTGLYKDDEIGLFNSGTVSIKNAKPITKGKVISSDNFSSIIELDSSLQISNLKAYWVFITQQNFSNMKVNVMIETFTNTAFENQLRSSLEGLNLVILNNKNAELLIKEMKPSRGVSDYSVSVFSISDGVEIKNITVKTEPDLAKVSDIVKNFAQSKFLKEIKLEDPKHNVVIELLPATLINGKYEVKQKVNGDGNLPVFKVGDTVLIKVTNIGTDEAYFNIIDIQPNGIINAVIPKKGVNGKEYMLIPGASKILTDKPLRLSPPTGTEIFKVFATSTPIDFTPIIASRGVTTRSVLHPLENVLKNSYQTRGADDISLDAEETGSTYEFIFKITD